MIPQAFLQDLLARVDIVDVIEKDVRLKKAGQNYAACCPFHHEKSPSFTVSPTKQFYHCFGCGAHGTAITFLMEHRGLPFVDAVEELAASLGLTVPSEHQGTRPSTPKRDDLHQVMLQATQYYQQALKQQPRAIDYLKKRGLSGEIAAQFKLGYAPDDWQNLASIWPDYTETPLLAEAGLVIRHDNGRRYDRFRDRIMFPILNRSGQVIGFGGRVIDQGEPKYLNSPETPLFEKGRELYGLFQARNAIRDAGRVVVVEGYMDVVALAQLGVHYAVATLGTATTPDHLRILARTTDQIVFCFDGDKAGRRAAWRALENALPLLTDGIALRFLFLPAEHDPDSFIREHGREAFEHQIEHGALPLSQFLLTELESQVDMEHAEGRAKLTKLAQPLVMQIQAPTLQLLIRRQLAERAGLEAAELDRLYGIRPARNSHGPAQDRGRPSGRDHPAVGQGLTNGGRAAPLLAPNMEPAAWLLLQLLVLAPNLYQTGDCPLPEDLPPGMALFAALVDWLELGEEAHDETRQVLARFAHTEHEAGVARALGSAMRRWPDFSEELLQDEYQQAKNKYFIWLRNIEIDALNQKARLGPLSDSDKQRYADLLQGRHPSRNKAS